MTLSIEEKIEKLEAKLRVETDPPKYAALALRLQTLTAAKKDMDDDEDDEDDEDEAKKAKKAAAIAAKKAEEEKKAAKKAEEEEKAKKAEEEAKAAAAVAQASAAPGAAALALLEAMTGRTGAAAVGAGMALMTQMQSAVKDTAELKAKAAETERQSLIGRASKYVPPHLVQAIASQGLEGLRAFVEVAEKGSPMVITEEGSLLLPKATAANTIEALPKATQELVRAAVSIFPGDTKAKASFEADLVKKHLESLNGASGRY